MTDPTVLEPKNRPSSAQKVGKVMSELSVLGNIALTGVALLILAGGFWLLHLRVEIARSRNESFVFDRHDVLIFAIIAALALLIGFANRLPYLAKLLQSSKWGNKDGDPA